MSQTEGWMQTFCPQPITNSCRIARASALLCPQSPRLRQQKLKEGEPLKTLKGQNSVIHVKTRNGQMKAQLPT